MQSLLWIVLCKTMYIIKHKYNNISTCLRVGVRYLVTVSPITINSQTLGY